MNRRLFALALLALVAGCGSVERTENVVGPEGTSTSAGERTTRPNPGSSSTTQTSSDPAPSTSSGPAATPAPTTRTPSLELGIDGLEIVAFGEDAETTIATLSRRLGAADEDSGWQTEEICFLPYREVGWGPLVVIFAEGETQWVGAGGSRHFTAYRYGNAEAFDSLELTSPQGVGLGSTVTDLARAFDPALELTDETIWGPVFVVSAAGDPQIVGFTYEIAVGRVFWDAGAFPYWGTLSGLGPTDTVSSVRAGVEPCEV